LDDVVAAADAALVAALQLVDQCQDPAFVTDEMRAEFVSYWFQALHGNEKVIHSLLDVTNRSARAIAVWYGTHYTLVGETADQLKKWLKHRGRTESSHFEVGVFGHLPQAPIPPFPNRVVELCTLLEAVGPNLVPLMNRCSIEESVVMVLSAPSPSGDGLIAFRVKPPSSKGFRHSQLRRPSIKMLLWRTRSELRRTKVRRFDAAWIHGRGRNQSLPQLRASRVLLLGAGSLGSQVAVRLAQSGVGQLDIVDPDDLSPSNVGRHALGVDAIRKQANKAHQLADALREKYPHMHAVYPYPGSWQGLLAREPQRFEEADLIVACVGEWSADGQLGEWQRRSGRIKPVVYGWLDELGTAAHALALYEAGPALSCVLGTDGRLRTAETDWPQRGAVQVEPACGTLYQPYGAVDVGQAEVLVSKLCLDVLSGAVQQSTHRVHAGPTKQIVEAGGSWSAAHLQHRPQGFEGAFEYERAIMPCGVCDACKAQV